MGGSRSGFLTSGDARRLLSSSLVYRNIAMLALARRLVSPARLGRTRDEDDHHELCLSFVRIGRY